MDTYTTGRSRTGHYRKPGSHLTYCGRTTGTPGNASRMCRPCVKAEALDRAAATSTAEAWLDQLPASPLAAAMMFGALVEAVDNRRAAEQAVALDNADMTVPCPQCHAAAGARCTTRAGKPARETHGRRIEALEQAAGITQHRDAIRRAAEARGGWLVTLDREAEGALLAAYVARINVGAQRAADQAETAGTWRAAWISSRAASPEPTLFDVEPDAEQDALFA
ncbi:zinc finger domain-containing protein [Streptomyces sp. B21-101]|uniref:zinc finger domain-containing protein n=1 Tax=Streptomyces sp. B21-101 TaxID=3039415 RepID=UPI002FF3719D